MTADNGSIQREVFIEAPQATVFAFFTDPDKMSRWMGVSHTLEPRQGGIFLVDVHSGNVAKGEFREVTPISRLVFTWGWDSEETSVPPGSSIIEVNLTPKDNGTLLEFTHSGLPEPAVAPHTMGWEHYLGRLTIAAAGGDPGPDPMIKK